MLKAQDVLVVIKLALAPDRPTLPALARDLALSLSEVHGAVKRATVARLLRPDRGVNRSALRELLFHGVKYVFPPKRGALAQGMPTAHAAPPLSDLIWADDDPPPVWPDPEGTVRGESFEPLYRSAPKAARNDARLYEALALLDAIRAGRARERAIAEKRLSEMLAP